MRKLFALGLSGLALAAGVIAAWLIGSRRAEPGPANYALLLYGASSGAGTAVVAESKRGTDGPRATVIGQGLLKPGGYLVFKPDSNPFSGVAVDVVSDPRPDDPVGIVLIGAAGDQAALTAASEHPHVMRGGRIVVRPIVPR